MEKREWMSINRWIHGLLPCAIYNGGPVSVGWQTLACFSNNAHAYAFIHTSTQQTSHNRLHFSSELYALSLSLWGLIFMVAALKYIKTETSQVSSLTSLFKPREDIKLQVSIEKKTVSLLSHVLNLKRENISVHLKLKQTPKPNFSPQWLLLNPLRLL